jgi:Cu-processing system ATP-binding protein
MIKVENVTKSFGKFQALKDVSLNCQSGECIALIGPNGCGKTTLIKSVLGMVIPEKGEIFFKEKNIRQQVDYRKEIGYMPQIGRYPDNMTIGQVVETIRELRREDKNLNTDLYAAYHIEQLKHKRMSTLSGGTRQKVSAALAFMFCPEVLILDEPTAGLDPLAAEILKERILVAKAEKKLILITSHILSELEDIVSELIFMQEGKMLFHKKTEVLKAETQENTIAKAVTKILRGQTV